jgi:hypothetical protein
MVPSRCQVCIGGKMCDDGATFLCIHVYLMYLGTYKYIPRYMYMYVPKICICAKYALQYCEVPRQCVHKLEPRGSLVTTEYVE